MWYTYVLRCADGSLYIGTTNDLPRRVARHHEGRASRFTASRRPVTLAYSEPYGSRDDAFARERQLKRWTRAKKEALVAHDTALLKRL